MQEYHHVSRRSVKEENVVLNNLPVDRSFILECLSNNVEHCVQGRFSVHNFQTGNAPILISLNITVELNKLSWSNFISISYRIIKIFPYLYCR